MKIMLNHERVQAELPQDHKIVHTWGSAFSIATFLRFLVRSSAVLLFFACLGLNIEADDVYHDPKLIYPTGDWHPYIFVDVRFDLQRVQNAWSNTKDHKLVESTIYKLCDLQYRMEHDGYNPRELRNVIGRISVVAGDNRLAPSDRTLLNDDLNKLRDYETNHDHWSHY